MLKIFVDSDAIPRPLRDALVKIADREKTVTTFIAAHAPRIGETEYVKTAGAGNAFNGADDMIVDLVTEGDLVITADIPLADRALAKKAEVLNTKGSFFTQANIKNALAMRELMDELRVSGEICGGPPPFSDRQRIDFINAVNRFLAKKRPRSGK